MIDETNPYRPPEADLGIRRSLGRYRPVVTVARVLIALWALFILAGPPRSALADASRRGEVAAKALGALVFVLAVFPLRKPQAPRAKIRQGETEDL